MFVGVFSSSLQLSDQPPLGSWIITVAAQVRTRTKKHFVNPDGVHTDGQRDVYIVTLTLSSQQSRGFSSRSTGSRDLLQRGLASNYCGLFCTFCKICRNFVR